jgi:hypothetical protein
MGCDELIEALHELFDTGEGAAADRFVWDQREEVLELIEPGAVGRNEVHVPARPTRQPRFDLRVAAA